MIFHDNRQLADDSHDISYLIFFENWERFRKKLSSAAVVTGALRVNTLKGIDRLPSYRRDQAYDSFVVFQGFPSLFPRIMSELRLIVSCQVQNMVANMYER